MDIDAPEVQPMRAAFGAHHYFLSCFHIFVSLEPIKAVFCWRRVDFVPFFREKIALSTIIEDQDNLGINYSSLLRLFNCNIRHSQR